MADWTTDDEIDYLKGIGSHGEVEPTRRDRIQLLKNYISAAGMRANWGRIDKDKVLSYAHQRLFKLEVLVS